MSNTRKNEELTTQHCRDALDREILVGAEKTRDNWKRFAFHVLENEYRVYHGLELIDSGQAVEELLEVYREL